MGVFDQDKTELLLRVLDHLGAQVPTRQGWTSVHCINPGHPDRSKSGSVNIGRGYFHCHACGLSGDGFDILQDIEGLNAKQVLETLGLKEGEEESEWLF